MTEKRNNDIINQFGNEMGTIVTQQALDIANLKVLLTNEKAKNAELQLQLNALQKRDDVNGGSNIKHK